MPKPRKNKQYWSEKQEILAKEFCTSEDQRRLSQIYSALKPRLYIAAEATLYSYIQGWNLNDKELLIQDAIDHALVYLKSHYKPERNTKAFSFLCTCMKNRYLDTCTNIHYKAKAAYEQSLIRLEDFPEMHEIIPCIDEEDDLDIQGILKHFKTLELKIRHTVATEQDGLRTITPMKAENLLEVLRLCGEYVQKFEDFNAYNVCEYVVYNTTHGNGTVGNYIKELFGVYVNPGSRPNKIKEITEKKSPHWTTLEKFLGIRAKRGTIIVLKTIKPPRIKKPPKPKRIKKTPEEILKRDNAYKLAWYYRNRERYKKIAVERSQRYYRENPQKVREYNQKWRQKNRAKIREYNRIRYQLRKELQYDPV